MYYGEKSLVVDDLIALVNSNGQMMPKQRLLDEHRDVKPQKSAEEQLNRLIGLSNVKESIYRRTAFYKVQSIAQQRGKKVNITTNMIFTGNPGTAKTTVARIYARYLYELNLSKEFKFIECTRSDLVERWAGHTAKKTREMVEKALGGVLFIDEAYSLIESARGGYGVEAINTLVTEIENHRELTVILAGYPKEMETFLNSNPGLRSRFSCVLHFEDYSINELCDISHYVASENGYMMGEGVDKVLADIFSKEMAEHENFGNGRFARNVVERAMVYSAYKHCRLEGIDNCLIQNMPDEWLFTLQPDDFEAVKYDK